MIVVYDIPKEFDHKRAELREYLKDWGGVFRQYSVYELDIPREDLERLVSGIKRVLRGVESYRVVVVTPCRSCYQKIKQVGDAAEKPW